MAMAGDITIKPDHVIIWLDKNMCVYGTNEPCKKILDDNANLNRSEEDELAAEISKLICKIDPELNGKRFETLITSPLRMFTEKNECIKCIHDSIAAKKQPFLITSGAMGALIVPEIHELLSRYIFVFCGQRHLHQTWTHLYENDIEIYDDEKGVFARMLSDIAIYYLLKGQNETSNQSAAIQYLHWARRLFKSASRLDKIKRDDYLSCVRDELTERKVPPSDGDGSDVPIGQDADES